MIKDIFSVLKLAFLGFFLGVVLVVAGVKTIHYATHASDVPNRGFLMNEMTAESVFALQMQIISLPYGSDLTVYIDSPGGSMAALNALFVLIDANNIHIHSKVLGSSLAASAAANFLVHSDTMEISDAAIIVFHLGSLCDTKDFCHKMSMTDPDPINRAIAESSAQLVKVALKKCVITDEQYGRVLKGDDVFIIGEEANSNKAKCE